MDNQQLFAWAAGEYARLGVDAGAALRKLDAAPLSIHCWQGDDVHGFEAPDVKLTGGIQATGNHFGRARNIDELLADLSFALSMIPGENKVNIHAMYLVNDGAFVDRNAIEPAHFKAWADWAADRGIGMDFNSSFFSHDYSADGSLSHPDPAVREFWIEHAIRCRKVGKYLGERTGKLCITNHWVHDGAKEVPMDTYGPRMRLMESLDKIFAEPIDPALHRDAVESKLFGIGSEAYVPGSHEFYMGYVMRKPETLLCLDAGHFHPTEAVSAKISALLCYLDKLLLHVSRPIRWDSDHVVLFDDETRQIMREVIRANALDRVYFATDYFDASINRIAAWCVGARNTKKALLAALLEPVELLRRMADEGNAGGVLLLNQELLTMPFGIIWDHYCETRDVPDASGMLEKLGAYEKSTLVNRI